jgi:hypothetical protein
LNLDEDEFDFSAVRGDPSGEFSGAVNQIIDFVTGWFNVTRVESRYYGVDFIFFEFEGSKLYRLTFKFIFGFGIIDPYLSMVGGFNYDLRDPIKKSELLHDILVAVPDLYLFRRSILSELLKGAEEI